MGDIKLDPDKAKAFSEGMTSGGPGIMGVLKNWYGGGSASPEMQRNVRYSGDTNHPVNALSHTATAPSQAFTWLKISAPS